jgi:ferric-dicitrate binding protein FerR (iron transport regulator)
MASPRLHELLELHIENRLDAVGQTELTALLRADPESRRSFWEAIEQHAEIGNILSASRGRDLALVEQMESMAETLPVRPILPGTRSWSARLRVLSGLIVGALILALLWFLGIPAGWFQREETTPASLARVVELDGELVIQSPAGGARTALIGADIFDGETLRVSGPNAFAVFEYADRSRYEITTRTVVRLTQSTWKKSVKELFLVEGIVRPANKNAGPMVITTPKAQLQLPGTSFVVSTLANEPLRVDVAEGEATVVRTNDQQAVTVHSGESVVVFEDPSEMEVTRLPAVSGEPIREIAVRGAIVGIFRPDGQSVLAFTRKEQWAIREHVKEVTPLPATIQSTAMATSQSGSHWAFWDDDRRVWIWDADQRKKRTTLPETFTKDPLLSLSPDGQILATVDAGREPISYRCRLRVWDTASGKLLWSHTTVVSVRSLAFSPDGGMLAVGVGDLGSQRHRHTCLHDANTGQLRGKMAMVLAHQFGLSFSPDGQTLATSFPNCIQLWDVPTLTLRRTIEGHHRLFTSVVYSPDGQLLAGRSFEGEIWLWNAQSGEHVAVIGGSQRRLQGIDFAPGGRQLLTRSHDKLLIWDVAIPE